MARTHEQRLKAIEEANKKNIVEVAQSLGMGLINQGQSYTWNEHDSFVITPRKNAFYWNSESIGGGVIQLVKLIKKCENKEAIDYLNNMEVGTFEEIQETKKTPFHYYMKEHTNKTVSMNYLTNERKLSEETVQFFISKGLLAQTTYKDKKTGKTEPAIVFKHKDLAGKIKGIALQGVWENKEIHGERGKLKKTYGDGFYGMSVRVGNSDKATLTSENPLRIIAFEAPIDLMSYYDLFKDTIGDAVLLSMNGLRKGTIAKFIANEIGSTVDEEEKPKLLDKLQRMGANVDEIEVTLAVDNDKAGKLFVDKFGISCLPVHSELPPLLEGRDKSDWNDLLKESKLGKEIPGELKGVSNKKMDKNEKSTDQPIKSKKEEQVQKWESLSREAQNEILIIYKENPVNFKLVLSKYGMEDLENVFTGLNSVISKELIARYNAELQQGVHEFNVERKEWLQRYDGFGNTMYIPESLWETAEKLGLMDNYPKIPFDNEEATKGKDIEQVLEMSKKESQNEKNSQLSDKNVEPSVENHKNEVNDNSRLSQAKRKLERLENEFDQLTKAAYEHVAQANGQPMNDKRGGAQFLKKMENKEEAIFSKLHEVESQRERVENLEYQAERKALGLNKQSGLIMSIDNLPRIKEEIERSKNGDSMYTRETIKKYEKKIVELENQKIKVEKGFSNLSDHAGSLIDSGVVTKWQKNPDIYFVKGLRKVALELTSEGDFQPSPKYLAKTEEEKAMVAELLSEKELNTTITEDNEKANLPESTDRFFKVEFNESNTAVGIPNYEGEVVTLDLIREIQSLESHPDITEGYCKFYFDEVVDGKVMNNYRMDVGDGIVANQRMYEFLIQGAVPKEKTKNKESSTVVEEKSVPQMVSEPFEEQTKVEGKEPLLETKEITSDPLLLTEKGWEATMNKKSNLGLLQVSQSNYLSDFKKAGQMSIK